MFAHTVRTTFSALASALVIALYSSLGHSAPVKTPHVEAELVAKTESFIPGAPIEAALRLKIIPHWHTYWVNPGDSGIATSLAWQLPSGFSAGDIQWPYPKRLPLGPLMNFGYEGEVFHFVTLSTPKNIKAGENVTLRAKAKWLVCSDVCIPEEAELTLTLAASTKNPAKSVWHDAMVVAAKSIPTKASFADSKAEIGGGNLSASLPVSALRAGAAGVAGGAVTLFPLKDNLIAHAGAQTVNLSSDGKTLTISAPVSDNLDTTNSRLDAVLVAKNGWGAPNTGDSVLVTLPLTISGDAKRAVKDVAQSNPQGSPLSEPNSDLGLGLAILFAFVGGLLLNLMPCVFPVLGLKVMSFAQNAGSSATNLRKDGVAFLVGVLISFWALAGVMLLIRASGEAIGWGFQLQSPAFVLGLAFLFFALSLNFFGVFEIGAQIQSTAAALEGRAQSTKWDAFLSGVLATLVATPCTAPFMGAAMGYTLSQPAAISMLVFSAMAIGMALPVAALTFKPTWLARLPRPGPWMETMRRLFAFPLLATVVWLVWVFGSQTSNDAVARLLFGLLALAFAGWIYGHWQIKAPRRALVCALAVAVGGTALAWPGTDVSSGAEDNKGNKSAIGSGWIPYSRATLDQMRAEKKPVFVDFTATWCITCQVNKRVALNSDAVQAKFRSNNIVLMQADWTRQDPAITQALSEFGRNGVPLNVYYPTDGKPVMLPEILTPTLVLDAIARADSVSLGAR